MRGIGEMGRIEEERGTVKEVELVRATFDIRKWLARGRR